MAQTHFGITNEKQFYVLDLRRKSKQRIFMQKRIMMLVAGILLLAHSSVIAQTKDKKKQKGTFYFSWGYNAEAYTRSTVTVSQPSLGNYYKLNKVKAHDRPGWNDALFTKALTIPQYNYRIGYMFNNKKDLGVEINFDHTKYIITDGQTIHVTGRRNNAPIDSNIVFNEANGFFYFLNNGANFLLFNLVKRWQGVENKAKTIKIDYFGKVGVGPVIPHVENSFFGQKNDPLFQLGGWNMGAEAVVRSTFYKHVYLEFSGKLDYARYSNLKIYKGHAKQAFGTAEAILSLGFAF